MQKVNISAVVLTKNEQFNIGSCLKSLSFSNEIIVIDDNSRDKTSEIAEEFGAKIYKREMNADYASQRNFALGKARGKWVLFVDADERVTPSLRSEIMQVVNNPLGHYSGFYIKRRDNLWGKDLKYGETGTIKLLRLARKGRGKWIRKVHEVWKISGPTRVLKAPLRHYPHPTLSEFIAHINIMSTIDIEAKRQEGKHSSLIKIVFWPLAKFIWNWKYKLGFLDGNEGFVVALMMSFHSFLSWSKLWVEEKHS